MAYNYDSSQVGVPYVRASRLVIEYPPQPALTKIIVYQELSVKLADNSIVHIKDVDPITFTVDLMNNGTNSIQLVDPTTGSSLGQNTNYINIMMGILAAIRAEQLLLNPS